MTSSPDLRSIHHLSSSTLYPEYQHHTSPSFGTITNSSPSAASPGSHSLWSEWEPDTGKEVVQEIVPNNQSPVKAGIHAYPVDDAKTKQDAVYSTDAPELRSPKQRRRFCGCLPLWLIIALVSVIVVLGIALGAGLSIGLKKKSIAQTNPISSTHTPTPVSPSTTSPDFFSKIGAFNGSGFALDSSPFDNGDILNLYFQHHTGHLRKLQLMTNGSWVGGDEESTLVTDARNATPLAIVTNTGASNTWHLFYIDANNIVRERISDGSGSWADGPLSKKNLIAMDDQYVGMQVAWYGGAAFGSTHGMHMWYASDPQTLNEYLWEDSTSEWTYQSTFAANGHAGIGCYSWGPDTLNYLMTVNLNNDINVLWKNMTDSASEWTNSSVIISGVSPVTSLGFTDYFFAQLTDGSMVGYNISFDGESTALNAHFKIPQKALVGTHFSVSAPSSGHGVFVFNQLNGTDIVQNIRDSSSAEWSYDDLSIPDS